MSLREKLEKTLSENAEMAEGSDFKKLSDFYDDMNMRRRRNKGTNDGAKNWLQILIEIYHRRN